MSRSRKNDSHTAPIYRQQLLSAMKIFLVAPLFSGGVGLRRWTLQKLTLTAILMSWGEGEGLKARFEATLSLIDTMFPSARRVGRTYQGFIKAMIRWSPRLLRRIEAHLRSAVRETAGACWETCGWVIMGVDGSKCALPRTLANEEAFGCSGRGSGGPHAWLTMIRHLATGLPWCWKIGKANASERNHLHQMIHLLPDNTLLVADAGFTGYELWKALLDADHSILIRVGANVKVLRKLGYYVEEREGIVYLWPDKQRKHQQPPLVLRLIRLRDGRNKEMCLMTNVWDASKLSDTQAASIYRLRWGLEVGFRTLKQTMKCRKLHSAAAVQAALELRWSVIGLTLLELMGVRAIMEAGGDPLHLSFAGALRAIRQVMREPQRRMRRTDSLVKRLGRALKDAYKRKGSKAARNWPHKKTERPPGCPKIRDANPTEIQAAKELRQLQDAA